MKGREMETKKSVVRGIGHCCDDDDETEAFGLIDTGTIFLIFLILFSFI